MKELNEFAEWANGIIGKYDTVVSEGFDPSSPLPERIPKSELKKYVSRKPVNPAKKTGGPSPEIAEKLRQLRAEFAGRAGIAEADQPPTGVIYSPLSATTRDKPAPDPMANEKTKREAKALRKFMGYDS